jgi:hypothetical protein
MLVLLAVVAGILAVPGITLFPWSAAFKVQSWLCKQRVEQSAAQVDFDSSSKWLTRVVMDGHDHVRVDLPPKIEGLVAGMSAKPEGFSVHFQAPDGTTQRTEQLRLSMQARWIKSFHWVHCGRLVLQKGEGRAPESSWIAVSDTLRKLPNGTRFLWRPYCSRARRRCMFSKSSRESAKLFLDLKLCVSLSAGAGLL